ncbi:hypothetical protein STRDD11_00277 [Streptococcus sp. DD11]|nr:hypothetical protein STRDD11_00277 [Streptococcus sp. DD11]
MPAAQPAGEAAPASVPVTFLLRSVLSGFGLKGGQTVGVHAA